MTEGSTVGSNDHAPLLLDKKSGGAWSLWKSIASERKDSGNTANFTDHVEESKWVSFTTTLTDPMLFNFIRDLSGSVAGEGGAMTFADSNWLFTPWGAASTTLPWTARGRTGVLGIWTFGR